MLGKPRTAGEFQGDPLSQPKQVRIADHKIPGQAGQSRVIGQTHIQPHGLPFFKFQNNIDNLRWRGVLKPRIDVGE